ncbi:MAG: RNA 2',3'-cyclic phosphodiesterase [Chloroflexota bacterium]
MPDRDRRPGRAAPGVPRLFVAVPVPPPMAKEIEGIVDRVRAALGPDAQRVRWVQMEGLHLTLRFLGPTPAGQVEAVASAVAQAAGAIPGPFLVRIGGAGVFPDPERPRALWLGIRSGADKLGQLSLAVTDRLAEAGWALDPRPFQPHLTIARTDGVRAGAEAGHELVALAADFDLEFTVDRLVLYRSHLGHGAARYEELRSVPLG